MTAMKALVVLALLGFVVASGYKLPFMKQFKQPQETGLKKFKYGPEQRYDWKDKYTNWLVSEIKG